MTIFFASDHHFGHSNIIEFCGRPFRKPMTHVDGHLMTECQNMTIADAAAMDEAMVTRHNAVVKPSDHVYFLGDVAMKRQNLAIVHRMNGHKRLIFGNHDIFDYEEYVKAGFEKLMAMRYFDGIMMTHVPIHPESMGRFKANAHGHVHNNTVMLGDKPDPRYINLSVEAINYTPISLEEIKQMVK